MEAAVLLPLLRPAPGARSPILTSVPLLPNDDVVLTSAWRSRRRGEASLIGRDHFVGNPRHSRHAFGKREQRLALFLRTDEPPEMNDAVANRDVSVAKTSPLLVLESRQQLKPNSAIGLVMLIDATDH